MNRMEFESEVFGSPSGARRSVVQSRLHQLTLVSSLFCMREGRNGVLLHTWFRNVEHIVSTVLGKTGMPC